MNSKQFNFCALPEDNIHFQEWFLNKNVKFIYQPIKDISDILSTTILLPKGEYNWGKMYLTSDEFVQEIYTESVEKSNLNYLNEYKSWAMEFSRPKIYSNMIDYAARFYYVTGYFDSDRNLISRPKYYLDWASELIKGFKKEFLVRHKTPYHDYFSIDALHKLK